MPDKNLPNDDLNQPNIDEISGDLNAANLSDDLQTISSQEIDEMKESAMNYNFEEVQPNPNEVKLDDAYATREPVTVRPVEFTTFDSYTPTNTDTNKNLELLMDIKLELTVELGRCQLPVKKVLELTRGSIIELDKIAGESVELFANGKHVANGEVVVIEDNFGLRITSITDPEERIKSL